MKAPKSILVVLSLLVLVGCDSNPKTTTSSDEALRQYERGKELFAQFYYTEAKESFEKALSLDPGFAMALTRLAYVHFRSSDEDSARRLIGRAVQLQSVVTEREQLYIRLFDNLIHYRNNTAAAVADSLIEMYPREAEAYVMRGNFYELNKKYEKAVELYEKAVKVDTSFAPAVMSLGYAYSARGDQGLAVQAMERYIRLEPTAADPRASYGDILLRTGRYDEALDQFRKSLELKPDYWYAINRIGDVYTILGRLNDAEKQYDVGMTKMVVNNQTRATRIAVNGDLFMYRARYDEALAQYNQALAMDSTNWKAAFGRTLALIKLKEFADADRMLSGVHEELSRRNLTGSSAMLDFHWLRAKFYEEQEKLDEALVACDSAMEYGSTLSRTEVYNEYATLHLKQRDFENAFAALEEALRLNSNYPHALLTLTKVYAASGDKQMAIEIGSRLLELWKNADRDFRYLKELQQILGRRGPQT
ncbi:MAG: tetratricopeptide repeat protein [Ignavibacteriae bacterium]|nr:tetratricopeptide repeat protein [Ignavibacteriota bacterium]